MDNGIIDLVKGTPNILGQIYTDLAQPGVKAVGQALGTVLEFSTSFLLPVKLVNEVVKLNFTKWLNEYKDKLEQIPEEKRCEVHPQIGTPIIEKLTYTTNDEIADLFTTLLASASNIETVNVAHPSFVNMIERLSPDEARIIKYLRGKDYLEYGTIKGISTEGYADGFYVLMHHVTIIPFTIALDFDTNINAYFDNLISLGILVDKQKEWITESNIYDEIKEKCGYDEMINSLVPEKYSTLSFQQSFFQITDFGKLFIKACIK